MSIQNNIHCDILSSKYDNIIIFLKKFYAEINVSWFYITKIINVTNLDLKIDLLAYLFSI